MVFRVPRGCHGCQVDVLEAVGCRVPRGVLCVLECRVPRIGVPDMPTHISVFMLASWSHVFHFRGLVFVYIGRWRGYVGMTVRS